MRRIKRKLLKKKNNKYAKKILKTSEEFKISKQEHIITENNRITCIHKYKKVNRGKVEIFEIICVSLEIRIKNKWKTIIYYDSSHDGNLHRHTKIAYPDESDITDQNNVKRKGTQEKLLEWAIKDIKNNFIVYRKNYLKRSKKFIKDLNQEDF